MDSLASARLRLHQYGLQRAGAYNKRTGFDAALDALRKQGLNQQQFTNLQGGHLPGHFQGMFMGMTPEQLKEIASFVNPQGAMQDTSTIDPITGKAIQAMHFNYGDPRAEGQAGAHDPSTTLPPWLRPPAHHQGGPPQWGLPGHPGPPEEGGPVWPTNPGLPFRTHDPGGFPGHPFRFPGRPFPGHGGFGGGRPPMGHPPLGGTHPPYGGGNPPERDGNPGFPNRYLPPRFPFPPRRIGGGRLGGFPGIGAGRLGGGQLPMQPL